MLMYVSTRGGTAGLSAAEAIQAGIAKDGGLFVPKDLPQISCEILQDLIHANYQERALKILQVFLPDYSQAELIDCIQTAYGGGKFDCQEVAPLVAVGDGKYVLELWHGPTSAFKDMALQLLPRLLSKALTKTRVSNHIVILVATSGDTGKAALEGFKDVPQTRIIVFYPYQGVSEIQRLQMVSQKGNNVSVVAVKGNFDDAQTGVKSIFNQSAFNAELDRQGYQLSSANSINWGRLVPQIVYYFSAYADMVQGGYQTMGQPVNFVVPTGNFGNILAGYYAKRMGLPIHRLICASNSNNVLTDFLHTGVYDRRRDFFKTISPSMDILISSNLERLLYHITEQNAKQVAEWMEQLMKTGTFSIGSRYSSVLSGIFWADWVSDSQTMETIKETHETYGYVVDPHTAVAWRVHDRYKQQTEDKLPGIIVSTASPFKFNSSVLQSIQDAADLSEQNEISLLQAVSRVSGLKVPKALAELEHAPIRHRTVCAKEEMEAVVRKILAVKE